MKKVLLMILLTVFFSAFMCTSYGDDFVGSFTDIQLYINETYVDSNVLVFKGKSFLSVREVAEALNLDVKWNENSRTIYLNSRDSAEPLLKTNKVSTENGSYPVVYSGIKLFFDDEPIDKETLIVSGSSYLPVRALGEALGLNVTWDNVSRRITLIKSDQIRGGEEAVSKQLEYTTCKSATLSHMIVNDDFVYSIDVYLVDTSYAALDNPNVMIFTRDDVEYNAATIMSKHGITRSQLIDELEMAGTNDYPLRISGTSKQYPYSSDCQFAIGPGLVQLTKEYDGSYGIYQRELFNGNQMKKEKFVENFLFYPMDVTIKDGEITSVIAYYTP